MDIGTLPNGGVYTPRDVISFKGVNSSAIGIVVTALPEPVIPDERVSFTQVPGKSGALTQREGTDIFNDITLTVSCYCPELTEAILSNIAAFFRGSGRLRLPNRLDGWYEATVINQIPLQQILRGNPQRTFEVNFRCKPLFHLDEGEEEITATNGGFLTNPGGIKAQPVITITGSGDITLLVGMQTVQLAGVESGIVLDSELQEAYYGNTLQNSKMSGDFPILYAGDTAISWTGTVTSVKVTPRWVSL